MDLPGAFRQAFTLALDFEGLGADLTYTSRALTADPAICRGTVARLGPDDEGYNHRVGTRYEVVILEEDLESDHAGTALTPQKLDKISCDGSCTGGFGTDGFETRLYLKVTEISREWGLYRLTCERDGRPDLG